MLPTVQLHNQVRIRADEIGDARADFMLTAEFPALQAAISKSMPEQLFGIGLFDTQLARSVCIQTLHP